MTSRVETIAEGITLYPGECMAVLADMEPDSVDSCVTDPPYHLTSIVKRFGAENAAPAKSGKTGAYKRASAGFMGKQWDGGEIAFEPETWAAVYRVLKPGGHLCAFGAPKNFGFMQYAISQGGFEIRDVICWLFGSGFPKSHNQPGGWGTALKPAYEPIIMARKPLVGTVAANIAAHGTGALNIDGCRVEGHAKPYGNATESEGYRLHNRDISEWKGSDLGRWPANVIHDGSDEVVGAFPAQTSVTGKYRDTETVEPSYSGNVFGKRAEPRDNRYANDSGSAARFFKSCPITDKDREWTRDRVSFAESSLCLSSEAAASALSHAVEASTLRLVLQFQNYRAPSTTVTASEFAEIETLVIATIQNLERRSSRGLLRERLTLSGSHACIVATPKQIGITTITISLSKSNGFAEPVTFSIIETNAEAGASDFAAKRFHYTSKADADDRLGSKHPTVKPVDLMQWLVRLVTPKGGLVLDPFAGTGTTGEAAFREGMRAVLIEREPEYQNDIRRRMSLVLGGPEERQRESIKARGLTAAAGPLFAEIWDKPFVS